MSPPPYTIHRPERQTAAVVFSSPHSGRDYPGTFLRASLLDERTIRSSEDAFVDLLFGCAPRLGMPLIAAHAPRAFIDLNRSAEELDPALIEGVSRQSHNPRVASGLGVIPRVVAGGRAIYHGKLARSEADARIEAHWRPYHAALSALMAVTRAEFGQAVLVDCHSMPHEALDNHTRPGQPRPDVVLGDRFSAAAGRDVIDRVEAAFSAAGLRVLRNTPFAGAYITQAYGRPSQNQHAVQVEIDRALYMDEKTVTPRPDFAEFQALIEGIAAELSTIGRRDLPLAAE